MPPLNAACSFGPSSAMSTAAVSGPSSTRCGLPTSTVRARRSSNSWGWSGPSRAGPMSTLAVAQPGASARRVLDGPGAAGRGHREARRRDEAGVDRRLGQAADAVAAHLGLAAVGVAQLHGEVAAVATGPHPDDAVGPDAAPAVGQQAHLGHREPDGVVGVEHDQEVVARPLVLGGLHRTILAAGTAQPCSASASLQQVLGLGGAPGPGDPRVPAEPRGLAAGELPGAPHRLLQAVAQGDAVLHVGQDLAVAERLAGRARDPGRTGGQRAHLVHQAGLDHGGEAGGDAAVDLVGRQRPGRPGPCRVAG